MHNSFDMNKLLVINFNKHNEINTILDRNARMTIVISVFAFHIFKYQNEEMKVRPS